MRGYTWWNCWRGGRIFSGGNALEPGCGGCWPAWWEGGLAGTNEKESDCSAAWEFGRSIGSSFIQPSLEDAMRRQFFAQKHDNADRGSGGDLFSGRPGDGTIDRDPRPGGPVGHH